MALSKKILREYDRFGPWILEIHSEDDIPDLFMSHFQLTDTTVLAFKVPHQIERRKVRPGDPLYDHILALDDTAIRVYHRTPEGITSRTVPYESVVAIASLSDLLQGSLSVFFDEGHVSVPFNTVSQKTIDRTVRELRERCGGATADDKGGKEYTGIPSTPIVDEMAPLYRNLYREELRRSPLEAIAYQHDVMIERQEPSIWEKLVDVLWRPRLRPTMLLIAEDELVLYRASPQIVFRARGYYGYERIVIPPRRVKEITTGKHTDFRDVNDLIVTVNQHTFRFSFGSNYPLGKVIERLKKLVV